MLFAAVFAGAGVTIGADLADDTTSSLTGLGASLLVVGFIVYIVAMFLIQVVAMTFYGGMFEMVIGAYRGNRGVEFGDLFSGFRKFGAYALYAVVLFGISLGLSLLNILPLIGGVISFVVSVWITVIWLYVLPLIADQGLGFGEAASRSNQMVKGAGWWWTFGMVVLLGLALIAAAVVDPARRLGRLPGERVGGDRHRPAAVPRLRRPVPALRDLLRERAVHRLRRRRRRRRDAGRRAARHPAGPAGPAVLRHPGLADRSPRLLPARRG